MRILVAQINPTVGDLAGNTEKIIKGIEKGREKSADIVLFSEMAVVGYPPEDFLLLPQFVEGAERQLENIVKATKGITAIVETIRKNSAKSEKPLCNTAAIITDGKLIGYQDKTLL